MCMIFMYICIYVYKEPQTYQLGFAQHDGSPGKKKKNKQNRNFWVLGGSTANWFRIQQLIENQQTKCHRKMYLPHCLCSSLSTYIHIYIYIYIYVCIYIYIYIYIHIHIYVCICT